MAKIHWLKTAEEKTKREAFCGKLSWKSLSSSPQNVTCRMCVLRMIRMLNNSGNDFSKTWEFYG